MRHTLTPGEGPINPLPPRYACQGGVARREAQRRIEAYGQASQRRKAALAGVTPCGFGRFRPLAVLRRRPGRFGYRTATAPTHEPESTRARWQWVDQTFPSEPAAHRVHRMLEIDALDPQGENLSLSPRVPGSSMIRDLVRHMVELRAHAAGAAVPWSRIDTQTRRCALVDGPLTVEWGVCAWDPSVRAAASDDIGGCVTGSSVPLRAGWLGAP